MGEGTGRTRPPPSEPPRITGEAQRGQGPACPGEGLPLHPPLTLAQAGSLPTPTLSLYLLGLDFCALADPEGPRPCFRSCMVTSWLAARGPRQGSGIQGDISPAPRPPPPTLGRAGQQGPGVALREAPAPPAVWMPLFPGACSAREPEALTGLFDGDGEAVVVGAALGLDGHVAGGVTCRRGRAHQARGCRAPDGAARTTGAPGLPGRLLREGQRPPSWRDRSRRVSVLGVRGTHRRRGTDTDRTPGLHGRSRT